MLKENLKQSSTNIWSSLLFLQYDNELKFMALHSEDLFSEIQKWMLLTGCHSHVLNLIEILWVGGGWNEDHQI